MVTCAGGSLFSGVSYAIVYCTNASSDISATAEPRVMAYNQPVYCDVATCLAAIDAPVVYSHCIEA